MIDTSRGGVASSRYSGTWSTDPNAARPGAMAGLKMGSAGPVGSSVGVARPSESWIGVGRDRGRAPRVPARVLYLGEAFDDRAHCPPVPLSTRLGMRKVEGFSS